MTRSIGETAGAPTAPWCCGRTECIADHPWRNRFGAEQNLLLAITARLQGRPNDDLFLLDTAAAWSLVGGDIAEALGRLAGGSGAPVTMDTRLVTVHGTLERVTFTLPADAGEDLQVDATVMVAHEWRGPPVIGFHCMLDRLRFAVDPGVDSDHPPLFYFGPCG